MFTRPCLYGWKNSHCNCAVAVRVGRDVFLLDKCDPKNRRKKMFRCVDNAMTIKETAKGFYEVFEFYNFSSCPIFISFNRDH